MGVRILEGTYDGTRPAAALVDSVTGTAFGPLFADHAEAESFLEWLERDVGPGSDARRAHADALAWFVQRFRAQRSVA